MESQIRNSVLNAISDDCETLELILDSVRRLGDSAATVQDVFVVLVELVKDGLAQAYELSPKQPHAAAVNIDLDRIEDLWFYATPKGIAYVTATNNRELTTDN